MKKLILILTVVGVLVFAVRVFSALSADAVPRITVKELKSMSEGGRDVVILDARSRGSYNASKVKIKGAIRISPGELQGRLSEIPKGKLIITYCT